MPGDWLWDGSGEPDPEEARLAELLGRQRYDRPAPHVQPRGRWRGLPVLGVAVLLAAAAALVVAWPRPERWSCGAGCELAEGEWLETGAREVVLEVADIGTMTVLPDSRLKLVDTSADQHRLELAVGSIHASVLAPPRLLVVDTPSAQAIDLGCEYDLTVLPDGQSVLVVQSGLVELAHSVRSAIVPAGAACITTPGHGPGIPWWVDDEQEHYADTLLLCDGGDTGPLAGLLAASRPRDTLSLWHLLQRVPDDDRARVLDRIAALDPVAHDLPRQRLLALDRQALDDLFDRLSDSW